MRSKFQISGLAIGLIIMFLVFSAKTYAQAKPWVAPKEAENVKNPLSGNVNGLSDAQKLYVSTCSPCHGAKGKGDGAAASALNPKPADHTSVAVQNQTDGALFWMITQGRNAMPQYKAILTDAQKWELINYIRTLSKAKK